MRRVLGIDPSLSGTGLAYADGGTHTITGRAGDERLEAIYDAVMEAAFSIELAVLEDLPTHAHGAGKTGMAQGVVRLALVGRDIPYVTVPPASLKMFATGNGGAGKPLMRAELHARTGVDIVDDNQVDAWWLREMGCHLLDEPTLVLPEKHTRALAKILNVPAVP